MTEDLVNVDQALYGYVEGHRLLASSTTLNGESQRLLRSLTDVAFDGRAKSHLTICPIPAIGAHAFIKTWPAESWNRPGSVWSHVLLVAFPDIGRLHGMRAIAEAFRCPIPVGKSISKLEIALYESPILVRRDLNCRPSPKLISVDIQKQIFAGLYEGDSPVRIQVQDASAYESTLLAIFEQQWPRLRRSFSCRTRQRSSSFQMDLEIIEQSAARGLSGATKTFAAGTWARLPVADLANPDMPYRNFLQLSGAESSAGRGDFRLLTEIYRYISGPGDSVHQVIALLQQHFPMLDQQRTVKRALFGSAEDSRRDYSRFFLSGAAWPSDEESRVALAVKAAPWIDLADINLGQRLVRLYGSQRGSRSPLLGLDMERIPMQNVEALVSGVTTSAEVGTVIALAVAQPDLGLLLAAQNKSILASNVIWERLDNDLLLELLPSAQDGELREVILDQLLDADAWEPIARICGTFPDDWWALLIRSSHRDPASLVARTRTLRNSLERLGTAALNSPPDKLSSFEELVMLLLSANLTSGLWRRASVADWTYASIMMWSKGMVALPRYARERLMSVALVAACQSGSGAERTRAWAACFPYLHDALASKRFDSEAWSLLSSILPSGPDWDRCYRLRRGVAFEIKKDRWAPDEIRGVVSASSPYEDDLLSVLEEKNGDKKERWLRQVMKLFT